MNTLARMWPRNGIPGRRSAHGRLRLVRQTETSDCGAACLTMILGLHGHRASLARVRAAVAAAGPKMGAGSLLRAARTFGLSARAFRLPRSNAWQAVPRGAIVHLRSGHYVVLESYAKGQAVLMDPAQGRVRMSAPDFHDSATDMAMVFEPGPTFSTRRNPSGPGRVLLQWVREDAGVVGGLATASLLLVGTSVAAVLAVVGATATLLGGASTPGTALLPAAAIVGTALAVRTGVHRLRGRLAGRWRQGLESRTTQAVINGLLAQPASFFQRNAHRDLILRSATSTLLRRALPPAAVGRLWDGLIAIVLLLVGVAAFGFPLVAPALAAGACLGLTLAHLRTRWLEGGALIRAEQQTQAFVHALVDRLPGAQTTRDRERPRTRWNELVEGEYRAAHRASESSAAFHTGLDLAPWVGGLIAGAWVLRDTLDPLFGLAALACAFVLVRTVASGCAAGVDTAHVALAYGDLAGLFGLMEQAAPAPPSTAPPVGDLELRGVSLRYPERPADTLRDVQVRISRGASVCVSGPSGAGKSSLLRLLAGSELPTSGTSLRPRPVGSHGPGLVHPGIAWVDATTTLDDGPLSATLGPDADVRRWALARTGLTEVVAALPLGEQTPITGRQGLLSRGERIRVAICAAITRNPQVLILDGVLGHFDVNQRRALITSLKEAVETLIFTGDGETADLAEQALHVQDAKVRSTP